ncbi:MAG: hypothetical protein ACRBBW_16705 [Cellvibrionaceae bacterium]
MTRPQGYQCSDCSYKGRQFPQGACPACGSRQVSRLQDSENRETKHPRWRLWLLLGLWGYLAFALFNKFSP